jgi:lysophospholipase
MSGKLKLDGDMGTAMKLGSAPCLMLAASIIAAPEPAPFLADIAEGPDGARAWWVTSADGTRLRLGVWHAGDARGTVLLFPGRTEYIEKYGRVARDLVAKGFTVVAFDWRGQGLADRPQHRRDMGHVTASTNTARTCTPSAARWRRSTCRGPITLIAHSMGGAIGLRALHDGLPVTAAAFSGPMWGIQMTALPEIHRRHRPGPRGASSASARPSRPAPALGSRWSSTTTR